jgi:hypothetical protein
LSRQVLPSDIQSDQSSIWGQTALSSVLGLVSVIAIGILSVAAGRMLAHVIWNGSERGLTITAGLLALTMAFLAGPPLIRFMSLAVRLFAPGRRQ